MKLYEYDGRDAKWQSLESRLQYLLRQRKRRCTLTMYKPEYFAKRLSKIVDNPDIIKELWESKYPTQYMDLVMGYKFLYIPRTRKSVDLLLNTIKDFMKSNSVQDAINAIREMDIEEFNLQPLFVWLYDLVWDISITIDIYIATKDVKEKFIVLKEFGNSPYIAVGQWIDNLRENGEKYLTPEEFSKVKDILAKRNLTLDITVEEYMKLWTFVQLPNEMSYVLELPNINNAELLKELSPLNKKVYDAVDLARFVKHQEDLSIECGFGYRDDDGVYHELGKNEYYDRKEKVVKQYAVPQKQSYAHEEALAASYDLFSDD